MSAAANWTIPAEALLAPVGSLEASEPIYTGPHDPVLHVVMRMTEADASCAIVLDGHEIVGIFTERDALTRVVAGGADPEGTEMRDVMTRAPDFLRTEDPIASALRKMAEGRYRNLPVVDDDGRPLGTLSQRDIVLHLVSHLP